MRVFVRPLAALVCAAVLLLSAAPSTAQSGGAAALTGLVVDQRNALPAPGAAVTLVQNGTVTAATTTDANGRYAFTSVPAGVYAVVVRARGYAVSETDDLALAAGTTTTLNAALVSSATSARTGLAVIGSTRSSNALAAATTITQQITPEEVDDVGLIRVTTALATLPATNFSTSSSPGDDASINLRGLGTDESAMLLDGHPVGPLGVGSGGFNFSLGPAWGLSKIEVTYGSGAQGLYGSDTIGGAVNFVTISPTLTPQQTFQQQLGGFGISSTALAATGTAGRFGYALAAARLGEYGDFAPGQIVQAARPDNAVGASANPNGTCQTSSNPLNPAQNPDVSACNLALNTYAVSQNTEQSMDLAKFTYAISPGTNLTLRAYDAVQWSDSTGNGDNDYLPYSTRLGQVNSGTPNCAVGGGAISNGYTVVTNDATGATACFTPQQLAAATYGPDGGGSGRDRSTRMADYDLRLTTTAGANNITVDGFVNNYVYWKNSSEAGGISATGEYLGTPTFANYYNTQGLLVSDDISTARNDFGFGYTAWHQLQTGNEDDASGLTIYPTGFFGEYSFFARDDYTITDRLSLFLNAWEKHSSVTDHSTFDPRATLQFRPTSRDVFQLTYGRSDGAPSPQLKLVGTAVASDPGASLTSVTCNGYNDVTSAGNPNLQSESANDFEIGYGHRFSADSNIQINAYDTAVQNQLFSASQPLLQYGLSNVLFAPGALQTYINRLDSQCGLTLNNQTVLQYLSVSTTYNAAHALARGLEFSGRQRFARIAYIDYGYYIESSEKTGISNEILLSNPTVVNGAQLAGIPLHQATLSLDVAPGPWEFRLDNYYIGFNNPLNRPAYWSSNAFLSYTLRNGRTSLTLGGTNIFNQAVQFYGYLGYGTAPITNTISGSSPAPSEEFGIEPAQLTFTLREKF
jgi:outer membrane receptor protein involved in Fe transport